MKFEIEAESRQAFGRSETRRMRRLGRVPAIIYGGGKDPSPIALDANSLSHQMVREAFYTSILTVKVGGNAQPVVVKEVQRHPYKPIIMHLDFQRIVADEEITITVPIHFLGEEAAVGVKDQGGVIEHSMTDVEISCLPGNLPEYLEIDVSSLELNGILHLSDIKYPEGVASTQLEHGHDTPVVAIHPPRREEVEEDSDEEAAPAAPAAEAEPQEESDED